MITGNSTIASRGRVFDPTALAGVAPAIWVDPASLSLADGAAVDTITNRGTLGGTYAQSTAGLRPLLRRAGRPAIDYDGSDDALDGGASSTLFAGSWTVVVVVELDGLAAAAGSAWLDAQPCGDSGGFAALTLRDNGGTPQVGCYRFTTGTAYATCSGVGARQVVAASYDNSLGRVLAQAGLNAAVTTTGTPATSTSGVIRLGGYVGGSRLNGKVLCTLAWASALSTGARESVIAAAQRYWSAP